MQGLVRIAGQMDQPAEMNGAAVAGRSGVGDDARRILDGLNDVHVRVVEFLRKVAAEIHAQVRFELAALGVIEKDGPVDEVPEGPIEAGDVFAIDAALRAAHEVGPSAGVCEVPFVLVVIVGAGQFARHEALEMVVKPRMGVNQIERFGSRGVVHLVAGNQPDNHVALRIPGHGRLHRRKTGPAGEHRSGNLWQVSRHGDWLRHWH